MRRLGCRKVADAVLESIRKRTEVFTGEGNSVPSLAVVLVGEDPASMTYVRKKAEAAASLGFMNFQYNIYADTEENDLLALIDELNARYDVDGILVQLPLPKGIDTDKVIDRITPEKDVDGFTPVNLGRLAIGKDAFVPCTPKGIMKTLEYYGIETAGRNVTVIGRSNIVGLPVAKLLLDENATVTIAHSKTKDLPSLTRQAEILVVAIGRPKFVTGDMVSEGAVVIDVGVNRDPETGKLCGDVDFAAIEPKASVITPVPGGVGPMTICCLMENTIECFLKRHGYSEICAE